MPDAIRCRNLIKTYPGRPPVEAVRGIDLTVAEGECFGVLGPNGAGKTTTIEILEGLLDPSSGEVVILGHTWKKDADAIRRQIGITLQDTQFPEKLSVRELVRIFSSFYPEGPDPEDVIGMVSLEDKADAWVQKLSGGQKQRLAIATSLVGNPRLLFLDEPTTGLDPTSRRQIWDLVTDFGKKGRTTLLTTHYMEEAERLCDRVAIIDRGKIIALGTPAELIAHIGAEHVIEFSLAEGEASKALPVSLPDLPGVQSATAEGAVHRLSVTQPHLTLPALMKRLETDGAQLAALSTRHATLEDVFVELTGRHLDEAEPAGPVGKEVQA